MSSASSPADYVPDRQKRTAVRVDVDSLPMQLWLLRRDVCELIPATFVNLSGSGGLIEFHEALPIGLNVHCRFGLPSGMVNSVDAQIVRSLPGSTSSSFKLGLHFEFPLEGKRDILVRWIFEEISRQRREQS